MTLGKLFLAVLSFQGSDAFLGRNNYPLLLKCMGSNFVGYGAHKNTLRHAERAGQDKAASNAEFELGTPLTSSSSTLNSKAKYNRSSSVPIDELLYLALSSFRMETWPDELKSYTLDLDIEGLNELPKGLDSEDDATKKKYFNDLFENNRDSNDISKFYEELIAVGVSIDHLNAYLDNKPF